MFIETHGLDNSTKLTFIKSESIQAYPCGRRRSAHDDLNSSDPNIKYYIPFDPEARLNTEANNRKHSSVNGYKNTFMRDLDNNHLQMSLAGYMFDVKLSKDYSDVNDFCLGILYALNDNNAGNVDDSLDKIYVNIRTEEVPLFSGFTTYMTSVLRNQSDTDYPETSLDLLKTISGNIDAEDIQDSNNYYFSGLSFSTTPITSNTEFAIYCEEPYVSAKGVNQILVSMLAFVKIGGIWRINEAAKLPEIEHGDEPSSVVIHKIQTTELNADTVKQNGKPVTMLDVDDLGNNTYQLHFSYGESV